MSELPRHQDRAYLQGRQYADDRRLSARAAIYERFGTNPEPWMQWAFTQLELVSGERVLECGCGPGWLWVANEDRVPADVTLLLTDLSAGMVATARRALAGAGIRAAYGVGDITALPLPDSSVDLLIANHMLYHVPNLPQALREIGRVLRPGGRFVAATNGGGHLAEMRDLAALLLPDVPWQRHSWIDSFTLENGRALLAPHFASVERRRYANALHITDAQAVIDYLASTDDARARLGDANAEAVRALIQADVAAAGAFQIGTDTGLFIARK